MYREENCYIWYLKMDEVQEYEAIMVRKMKENIKKNNEEMVKFEQEKQRSQEKYPRTLEKLKHNTANSKTIKS